MKICNKSVLLIAVLLAALGLAGCSTSVVALSEKENKEIARYIADKLLQNDVNYRKKELVYMEPVQNPEEPDAGEPTEQPKATESPTDAPGNNGNAQDGADSPEDGQDTIMDWNQFFTTDEWTITYSSYDTYKTYPDKPDTYEINASQGKELLVLFFDVKNLTGKKININMVDSKLKYKLNVGGEQFDPQIAVLENGGLMYLNTDIPAGRTIKTELVFEIPEGTRLTDMRLDVSR